VANEIAQFIGDGGWSWFQDPRAVFHQGTRRRTYVGWVDQARNIRVASYDHDTREQVIVILASDFSSDDHDVPAIEIEPDGRIIAFWSGHAGPEMFYRRTARPEDLTVWEPLLTVPVNTAGASGYTYPNPICLPVERNKLWLFWRGGNFNPTFSTTIDRVDWAPARNLILVPGQRPYVKYISNGSDSIHFAFTEAHPRSLTTSIYYAVYRAGAVWRADGSRIAALAQLPMTPSQSDKVWDGPARRAKAWTWDIALDAQQRPVITFASFPTDADHRYHYARWNGARWVVSQVTAAGGSMNLDPAEPNYSGGITLDKTSPNRVYVSRQVDGVFELDQRVTADGGETWTASPITTGSTTGHYRPVPTRRRAAGSDLDVFWMHGTYPSYVSFRTALLTHRIQVVTPVSDLACTAVRGSPDRIDLYALSTSGSLLQRTQRGPGQWSDWIHLGRGPSGHALGRPAAASWAPGRIDLFAVDQVTGHLLHKYHDGQRWTLWIDRGLGPDNHRVADPAAVSWGPGRVDIVARDAVTNDLVHWWYQPGSWRGPERLAASPGGAFVPSIASWAQRRLDIVTITDAGRLARFSFDGTTWQGWEDRGRGPGDAAYVGPAAVAAWGERRLDVFATTTDRRSLAHVWYDGAWRGPEVLRAGPDQAALAGMAATSFASRRLDVFTTEASTGDLLHTWFDGRWHNLERLHFVRAPIVTLPVQVPEPGGLPSRAAVLDVLRRVNDHWIGNHPDPGPNDWARATYFSGDMALYRLVGEPGYLDYASRWAEAHRFGLLGGTTTRNADNQCAGQVYLDLHELQPDPVRIADIEACIRNMVYGSEPDRHGDWTWVDALHMAMPVFTRLGALRSDPNYWIKLYRMYNHTKRIEGGGLYDQAGRRLWWRDKRFIPPGGVRSPNGKDVVWSRGNGWAVAAHVKTLKSIPATDLRAPEYRRTLAEMCQALVPRQRTDGFWNTNLADDQHFPGPETSGTAFFTYGMAYGVSSGLLAPSTYLPVVARAWNGMVTKAVRSDGLLGYVQPASDRPGPTSATTTTDFGVGAFLLAGIELARLTS
jgi:unsaturated rhamnogalacturonyl hydrolase